MTDEKRARRSAWVKVIPLALSLVAACSGAGDGARLPAAVRTDSAGVEIFLNDVLPQDVPAFASLDSLPTLRLGAVAGRPEEEFGSVVDVLPLDDGGVAILDGQAAEIRLFDSVGTFRSTLGSKGEGPGELQSPRVLALLPGDTLAVYDMRLGRVTHFGPDGALGRITTLSTDRGRTIAASFLGDGRLVGQSAWLSPDRPPLPGSGDAFVRDTAVLTLFASDGAVEDTIEVLPGREAVQRIDVGEGFVSVFKRLPLFGRTNLFTAHPDGVWSSTNDAFELRLLDVAGGGLTRIVRAPGLEEPLTDELDRGMRDRELEGADSPEGRRDTEDWLALSRRPDVLPAFDRILVDDQARLWVRSWTPPDSAARWWVFSRGGDLLGSVEAPPRLTVLAVRCRGVWGVERDELGVSYVVRYLLRVVGGC